MSPTGMCGVVARALPLLAGALFMGAASVQGQLASAVAGLDDGTVRFTFPVKPGVEICDDGVRAGGSRRAWRRSSGWERGECWTGTAVVELDVRGDVVREARLIRPSDRRTEGARDVGEVTGDQAAAFLLDLAQGAATSDAAKDGIFVSTLADTEGVWRRLVAIARDRELDEDVRKGALFWLGQEVAEAATVELRDVAVASDEEQEVRESAIFALSQRPPDQAIPTLMEVAREAEDVETVRVSLFWLAQFEDERVVDFFEDMLSDRER